MSALAGTAPIGAPMVRSAGRGDREVDLLLLNCSNLSWRPIFPYAFVQVSEVASRHGLRVARQDMLYVDDWQDAIRARLRTLRPRMVGIHLRQADTVDLSDYYRRAPSETDPGYRTYFPVEDTRRLIDLIRAETRAPVVLGGFGFSTHARRLATLLEIDLGVVGCPDGFFERFEDVAAGRNLSTVPNLVRREGGDYAFNPRAFYDPARRLEYDDAILRELSQFYGDRLAGEDPPTIAVEVSRGCPFQCFFCTEPDVKGRRLAERPLDVVEEELRGLLKRGLRDFWFVCSELNIRGSGFAFELAERVIRLGEAFPGPRPIRWSGYALPSLERDELQLLKRAGYTGAINDILSLDDDNLKRARVPYRADQAVRYMRTMIETRPAQTEAPHDPNGKFTANSPARFERLVSMFLGNAHICEDTIARTLRTIEENGLSEHYREGYAIPSTRVFPIGRTADLLDCETTVSIGRDGVRTRDSAYPTFHFPAVLQSRLGSRDAVIDYLDYVAETFLSTMHRHRPKWRAFVERTLGFDGLAALSTDADGRRRPRFAQALAADPPGPATRLDAAADDAGLGSLLRILFEESDREVERVQTALGSDLFAGPEPATSEYRLTQRFYEVFISENDYLYFVNQISSNTVSHLYLKYCEAFANFKFDVAYRDLSFGRERWIPA